MVSGTVATHCQIERQILVIDKTICNSIEEIDPSRRGFLSQLILSQLRNFVEHIMLKVYAVDGLQGQNIDDQWDNICKAVEFVKSKGNLKFLRQFHDFLQISASHYTLEEEGSERLLLKYYEYLLRAKSFLRSEYSLDVLENLDKFPLNTDSTLKEYYEKIAHKVDLYQMAKSKHVTSDTYYIQKIKPFFVNQKIYYEVTFTPVNEKASKFDRVIAFTALDISRYYAVKLFTVDDRIEILGKTMPVFIIIDWETWIRPCEINNFSSLVGFSLDIKRSNAEYRNLMRYLSRTGFNLVEIVEFSDTRFKHIKLSIVPNAISIHFFDVLEKCREVIKGNKAGSNILRYLLYHLNNSVIKFQRDDSNNRLSSLNLNYGCIPFDDMPFNSSLRVIVKSGV